jgi:hypothetical protein
MRLSILFILFFNTTQIWGNSFIKNNEQYSTFCRIYGVVKYYANDVVSGKVNWDNRTIDYLSRLDSVQNKEEFNQLLSQYLSVIFCKNNDSSMFIDTAKIKKKFNLKTLESRISFDWINTDFISASNQKKLKNIVSSFEFKKNVGFDLREKGKVFNHRQLYKFSVDSLNRHHYLLGFFQFWNAIEYFYPYKYLMDKKWDSVLDIKVASFLNIQSRENYKENLNYVASFLNDSHVAIKDLKVQNRNDKWHPLTFRFIQNKVVFYELLSDSLKDIPTIKKGDILTHINHISIDTIFKKYLGKTSNSNLSRAAYLFSLSLHSSPKSLPDSVCFTFDNNIDVNSIKLPYTKMNRIKTTPQSEIVKDLDSSIGYVNVSNINFFKFGRVMRNFRKKKYVIFDCRGYAGLNVLRYGTILGGKPKNVTTIDYPLYYLPGFFTQRQENYFGSNVELALKLLGILPSNAGNIIPSFKKPYKGKGVILINEKVISFGETNILTLKTYCKDCVMIGSNTAGANGDVSRFNLIGDLVIGYTGIDLRSADGTITQRKGIVPNIEVSTNVEDYQNDVDTILSYAIEYCKKH